ncbi:MAG: N-formylglutamate amidohydrolase [Burkholderiales bacterium]|nr:N-formylglutamate amidohydrolase [Burkholderiales bacterium]
MPSAIAHQAPVQHVKPEPGSTLRIPLVCDSPHSGTDYPADFGFSVASKELRRSEDTHVEKLWASVPQHGGELISASFPRSYIDPNRTVNDIDQAMLSAPWPSRCSPSKRCIELGNGLVFSKTTQLSDIYQRKLSVAEVQNRIDRYWRPYRETLDDALQSAAQEFGVRWHLNLHSMPSNAYQRLGIVTDKKLADIVLGDVHGVSCSGEFTQVVSEQFKALGYSVAINDPYAGMDLLRQYGQPERGFQSLQIEINRAMYLDEDTREPSARFSQMQADIGQVLKGITAYIQAALPSQGTSSTSGASQTRGAP